MRIIDQNLQNGQYKTTTYPLNLLSKFQTSFFHFDLAMLTIWQWLFFTILALSILSISIYSKCQILFHCVHHDFLYRRRSLISQSYILCLYGISSINYLCNSKSYRKRITCSNDLNAKLIKRRLTACLVFEFFSFVSQL